MRPLLAVAVFAALVAVLALAASAPAASTHRCRRIDIKTGGAEASAVDIRARGLGCRGARRVVRACLAHRVARHWHASLVADRSSFGVHLLLTSRPHRRITFHAGGAGGCISS